MNPTFSKQLRCRCGWTMINTAPLLPPLLLLLESGTERTLSLCLRTKRVKFKLLILISSFHLACSAQRLGQVQFELKFSGFPLKRSSFPGKKVEKLSGVELWDGKLDRVAQIVVLICLKLMVAFRYNRLRKLTSKYKT